MFSILKSETLTFKAKNLFLGLKKSFKMNGKKQKIRF
jgi:hypothetical protein